MKTKTIRGVKCRLISDGISKPTDWVVSEEGHYEPHKCSGRFVISAESRKGGQGDYYRPIPKPSQARKGKTEGKAVAWMSCEDFDDMLKPWRGEKYRYLQFSGQKRRAHQVQVTITLKERK